MLQGSLGLRDIASVVGGLWHEILLAVPLVSLLVVLWTVVYRFWFHPLAAFPGEKIAAVSQLPQTIHLLNKSYPNHVKLLHNKFGQIVRVAPNELTFCSPKAWKDIYGLQAGQPRLVKDPVLYCPDPFTNAYSLISAEGDLYQRLRRPFSSAFSEASLLKQEAIIQHHVQLLLQKLSFKVGQHVDLAKWFTWVTFDILGALAFGKPFGSLQSEETHFWVSMIEDAVRSGVFLRIIGQFPWLEMLLIQLIPEDIMERRRKHVEYSREALRDCKEDESFGTLLGHWNSHSKNDISEDEKVILFSDMIIAGSETTATMLSATLFYLAKNTVILKKLRNELQAFNRDKKEMNARNLANLPLLTATIEESLRILPPVPQGLPRIVPKGGREICGHHVPEGTTVSVHSWAITHNEALFPDPENFDPGRFLGNDSKGSNREASQPFSTGPRGCIGRALSWIEMRLILAGFISEFDVELCVGSEDWIEQNHAGVVWEKAPLMVNLRLAEDRDIEK